MLILWVINYYFYLHLFQIYSGWKEDREETLRLARWNIHRVLSFSYRCSAVKIAKFVRSNVDTSKVRHTEHANERSAALWETNYFRARSKFRNNLFRANYTQIAAAATHVRVLQVVYLVNTIIDNSQLQRHALRHERLHIHIHERGAQYASTSSHLFSLANTSFEERTRSKVQIHWENKCER